MPAVILQLKDGGRYRQVGVVHRSSNGNAVNSIRTQLENRGKSFLEFRPIEMSEEQRDRLRRASNSRDKGVLVDLDERRLVLASEVENG